MSPAEPAKKVTKISLRVPSEPALRAGKAAAKRVNARSATVRRAFFRANQNERPPLTQLLVGGQGGEVRLKLYVSLLFIAVAEPYSTRFPSRAWAELLDLPVPTSAGARRVREAIRWLESKRYIRVERRPGIEPEIFLLSERGDGASFQRVSGGQGDTWAKLPSDLWSNGWVAALSGRAFAILLLLMDYESQVAARGEAFWIPPRRREELYSVSEETWGLGARELELHGLTETCLEYIHQSFAAPRRKKVYKLIYSRLGYPPNAADA